jgi:hypothetical protein
MPLITNVVYKFQNKRIYLLNHLSFRYDIYIYIYFSHQSVSIWTSSHYEDEISSEYHLKEKEDTLLIQGSIEVLKY